MDFFLKPFSFLRGKESRDDASSSPTNTRRRLPNQDFAFAGDEIGITLRQLWETYDPDTGGSGKLETLNGLIEYFLETHREWQPRRNVSPDTPAIEAMEAHGHPTRLLRALAFRFKNDVSAVKSGIHGDNLSDMELKRQIQTLRVMVILTRSVYNCEVLTSTDDSLEKVMALLRTCVSRMTSELGSGCCTLESEEWEELLEIATLMVHTLHNFAEREGDAPPAATPSSSSRRRRTSSAEPDARTSRSYIVANNGISLLFELLLLLDPAQYVPDWGGVADNWSLLLQLLAMKVLVLLLADASEDQMKRASNTVMERYGRSWKCIDILIARIGWPQDSDPGAVNYTFPSEEVFRESVTIPSTPEIIATSSFFQHGRHVRLQLGLLRVLLAAVQNNSQNLNLALFSRGGGFEKLIDCILFFGAHVPCNAVSVDRAWASLVKASKRHNNATTLGARSVVDPDMEVEEPIVPGEYEDTTDSRSRSLQYFGSQASGGSSVGGSIRELVSSSPASSPTGSLRTYTSLNPPPPARSVLRVAPLLDLFEVLYGLLLVNTGAGEKKKRARSRSKSKVYDQAKPINENVLAMLMDVFNVDVRHTPLNAAARRRLFTTTPLLQLYCIDLLKDLLLRSRMEALSLFRSLEVWDVLLQTGFFYRSEVRVAETGDTLLNYPAFSLEEDLSSCATSFSLSIVTGIADGVVSSHEEAPPAPSPETDEDTSTAPNGCPPASILPRIGALVSSSPADSSWAPELRVLIKPKPLYEHTPSLFFLNKRCVLTLLQFGATVGGNDNESELRVLIAMLVQTFAGPLVDSVSKSSITSLAGEIGSAECSQASAGEAAARIVDVGQCLLAVFRGSPVATLTALVRCRAVPQLSKAIRRIHAATPHFPEHVWLLKRARDLLFALLLELLRYGEEYRAVALLRSKDVVGDDLGLGEEEKKASGSSSKARKKSSVVDPSQDLSVETAHVEAAVTLVSDRKWVDTMFKFIESRDTRRNALEAISLLMGVVSRTEGSDEAREQFYTGFMETLPRLHLDSRNTDLSLVLDFLRVLRVILERHPRLQRLFREAGCFLQVLSLLTSLQKYPHWSPSVLCTAVLRTLGALMADNSKSKDHMRRAVGYDQLKDLIVGAQNGNVTADTFSVVMDLTVDGEFFVADATSCKVRNADMLPLALELLEYAEPSTQRLFFPMLADLVGASTNNTERACHVGLLDNVLSWVSKVEEGDGLCEHVFSLLVALGSHSVTVKQLKRFLALFRAQSTSALAPVGALTRTASVDDVVGGAGSKASSPSLASQSMGAASSRVRPRLWRWLAWALLQMCAPRSSPTCFFDFSGARAGIVAPTVSKWPPQSKGYSFSTWVCLETLRWPAWAVKGRRSVFPLIPDGGSEADKRAAGRGRRKPFRPYLFSCYTKHGQGFEAYFEEGLLHVKVVGRHGKPEICPLSYTFSPGVWTHIALTHAVGRLNSPAELRLYVNGKLVSSCNLVYPVLSSPLAICRFANSASMLNPFVGQMAAVYLFDDVLSKNLIAAICSLGPGYMQSFDAADAQSWRANILSAALSSGGTAVPKSVQGSESLAVGTAVAGLFDGSLTSKIFLSYNPRASEGRVLLDSTPDDTIRLRGALNARLGRETQVCNVRRVPDIISCLGGIEVTYPLIAQLNLPLLTHARLRAGSLLPLGERHPNGPQSRRGMSARATSLVSAQLSPLCTPELETTGPSIDVSSGSSLLASLPPSESPESPTPTDYTSGPSKCAGLEESRRSAKWELVAGSGEEEEVALVMRLPASLLRESPGCVERIIRSSGFAIIHNLLLQISPALLSPSAVEGVLELCSTVRGVAMPSRPVASPLTIYSATTGSCWSEDSSLMLEMEAAANLLYDGRLWLYASAEASKKMYTAMKAFLYREALGVQCLLDLLRRYYWYKPDEYSCCVSASDSSVFRSPLKRSVLGVANSPGVSGNASFVNVHRPEGADLRGVRSQILELLWETVRVDMRPNEAEAIVSSIVHNQDTKQQEELLSVLLKAVTSQGVSALQALSGVGGPELFIQLMNTPVEGVRLRCLAIVSRLVSLESSSTAKQPTSHRPFMRSRPSILPSAGGGDSTVDETGEVAEGDASNTSSAQGPNAQGNAPTGGGGVSRSSFSGSSTTLGSSTAMLANAAQQLWFGAEKEAEDDWPTLRPRLIFASCYDSVASYPRSAALFNTLLAALLGQHTESVGVFSLDNEGSKFENLAILPIIFPLLLGADAFVIQKTLQDLSLIMSTRPSNRQLFARVPGWQDSLLRLLVQARASTAPPPMLSMAEDAPEGDPEEDLEIIRDQIFNIIRTVHVHCLCNVSGAWRDVEETFFALSRCAERGVLDACEVGARIISEITSTLTQCAADLPLTAGASFDHQLPSSCTSAATLTQITFPFSSDKTHSKFGRNVVHLPVWAENVVHLLPVVEDFFFPQSHAVLTTTTEAGAAAAASPLTASSAAVGRGGGGGDLGSDAADNTFSPTKGCDDPMADVAASLKSSRIHQYDECLENALRMMRTLNVLDAAPHVPHHPDAPDRPSLRAGGMLRLNIRLLLAGLREVPVRSAVRSPGRQSLVASSGTSYPMASDGSRGAWKGTNRLYVLADMLRSLVLTRMKGQPLETVSSHVATIACELSKPVFDASNEASMSAPLHRFAVDSYTGDITGHGASETYSPESARSSHSGFGGDRRTLVTTEAERLQVHLELLDFLVNSCHNTLAALLAGQIEGNIVAPAVDENGEALAPRSPERTIHLFSQFSSQKWRASLQSPMVVAALRKTLAELSIPQEGPGGLKALRRRTEERRRHAMDCLRNCDDQDVLFERQRVKNITEIVEVLGTNEDARLKAVKDTEESCYRAAARLWRNKARALMNERGPWGPGLQAALNKKSYWKLDKREDRSRRRMRLKRNYNFDPHTGAAHRTGSPKVDRKQDVPKPVPGLKPSQADDVSHTEIDTEAWEDEWALADEPADSQGGGGHTAASATADVDHHEPTKHDHKPEKLLLTLECQLIKPLHAVPATLKLTTHAISVLPKDPSEYPPTYQGPKKKVKDRHFSLSHLKSVYRRRYILQPSALEFFFADAPSFFINFPQKGGKQHVRHVMKLIQKHNRFGIVLYTPDRVRKVLREVTERWQNREISNFDYLMRLNTLAGRTYADITQYPVFPWVLNDYTSPTIDLSDESVYRDLSKPIGALDPKRLEFFKERFNSFVDPEIPPFHYGSHYSSSGIVLFYLVRTEPFTTQFLQLQGGKFDYADRMFDSIPGAWLNCLTNTSDVKELIPEFFYLPDFLLNSNEFDLGSRQNGTPLNDVDLPAWASTPDEFVRIHRLALESEYVSNNLHLWIDLIFGFKQRGKRAEEACNLFYYLTYEGGVDLNAIEDEGVKLATQTQINNFGQTPSQLFTKPHPKRNTLVPKGTFWRSQKDLHDVFQTQESGGEPVVFLEVMPDRIVTLSLHRMLGIHRWSPLPNFNLDPYTFEVDRFAPSRRRIGVPFYRKTTVNQNCFALSKDGRVVFSCGHWDNTFKTTSADSHARVIQSVSAHKDVVTCMSLSQDGLTLVTGSRDATVMVFAVNPLASGTNRMLAEKPRHVLYGHDDEVTCVTVHSDLDIVVSASKDGTAIIHSLREGAYIRSLVPCVANPPLGSSSHLPTAQALPALHLTAVGTHGHVVVYSAEDFGLHLWMMNGRLLQSVDACERLTAMVVTEDGEFLVTGGERRFVVVRRLYDLKVVKKFPSEDCPLDNPITSLVVSPVENVLLVGLTDGRLHLFSFNCSPSK
eukprot:Rmarinus@m.16402